MKKRDVSREVYKRIHARCRWRGVNRLNLKGEDLAKFVSECIDEEIAKGRTGNLQREEKVEKFVENLEEPQKPKRVVYVNLSESGDLPLCRDFFQNPKPSRKQKLDSWMRSHGKVDYPALMKKLKELDEE